MLKASWEKHTLNFKQASGTSRGILRTKDSYFIKINDGSNTGIGECGILKGLSYDDRPDYEQKLAEVCSHINEYEQLLIGELSEWPSIHFGLEMALRDLETGGSKVLFQSKFSAGLSSIPINGLVWMGTKEFMHQQIDDKLAQGFDCIKLKIGAIDFQQELDLLEYIRQQFPADKIEIRVDANGAFTAKDVRDKLSALAKFDLHSIEQPIKPKQWELMADLCKENILPIALDEELIGVTSVQDKKALLNTVNPPYIILKPSLIGGFKGSLEWINLAEMNNINWWITSALESNIGLSAIAQWTATFDNPMPQGLGTGGLYTNNFKSPLEVEHGALHYRLEKPWEINLF